MPENSIVANAKMTRRAYTESIEDTVSYILSYLHKQNGCSRNHQELIDVYNLARFDDQHCFTMADFERMDKEVKDLVNCIS